jgi:hypothetical protein
MSLVGKLTGRNYFAIFLLFLILVAICVYIWFPEWQIKQFGDGTDLAYKQLMNEYRRTVIQALGGLGALILIWFAWENLMVLQKAQRTDRFTRAIDQLGRLEPDGSPSIEIRMGGIYALAQLADQREDYRTIVVDVLAAYLRENSRRKAPAALTERLKNGIPNLKGVASRLEITSELHKLHESDISFYEFLQEELRPAGSDFQAITRLLASLVRKADQPLDLADMYLRGTEMKEACLKGAVLARSHLGGAIFDGADLEKAELLETNWHGASLKRTILRNAKFRNATLIAASFDGADVTGADFSGADLRRATGLTPQQLAQIKAEGKCDAATRFPEDSLPQPAPMPRSHA